MFLFIFFSQSSTHIIGIESKNDSQAYKNHWVLRTSPDDWFFPVIRRIAQVSCELGQSTNENIVDHKGWTFVVRVSWDFKGLNPWGGVTRFVARVSLDLYNGVFGSQNMKICHNGAMSPRWWTTMRYIPKCKDILEEVNLCLVSR